MSCWTILGITPTKNIDKIKGAYVELSNSINKSNEEYDELRIAYNKAISLATTSISDLNMSLFKSSSFDILSALINSSIDNSKIDSIDKFISNVNDLYTNPSLRFNKEPWINLLTLPIIDDLSLSSSLEKDLINYLLNHKYLPNNIYTLIDSRFNWTNREDELKALYPSDTVNFIINAIKNPIPLSFDYLSDIRHEKLDEYLSLREKAFLSLQSSDSENYKNYLFAAYSIYAKDLDLLKLIGNYYLNKDENLLALNYFREAININNNDMYSLSKFGHLLAKTTQYSKAILYLEKYLKMLRNSIDIEALIDLAYCYYYSYDLQKAKDLFILLIKLRPWDLSLKVDLENINTKLLKDTVSNPLTIPIYKKYLTPYLMPFITKIKEIYNNFSLRTNENSWKELFTLPIASNDTLFYLLEQYVIDFVTNNKNIPQNIYTFINKYFNWTDRHDELISIYPNLKIDFLFNKLYLKDHLSYDFLNNTNANNLEEYVELRSFAYDLINAKSTDAEYYLDKALDIFNGDFELFKLYGQFYTNNNQYDKAIENFKIALSLNPDEYYSCCSLAVLLTKIENFKESLYYLEQSVNTPAGSMLLDNEDFLTKYAISYYYTNDLINAKKCFKKLSKLNSNINFIEIYLKNINDRLAGKKRSTIPIAALNDPNYLPISFTRKTKSTLNTLMGRLKTNMIRYKN